MLPAARDDAGPLLGRDAETERLFSLLTGIEERGAALVLRGEPGVGKSRLLAESVAAGRERDIAVLTTTGFSPKLAWASRACISSYARCATVRPGSPRFTGPRSMLHSA